MKIFSVLLLIPLIFFAHVSTVSATSGSDIAKELMDNYNNKAVDCGSTTTPAFLCSGVLMRGTTADTTYHSWDPSPNSQSSGGMSFSYLRADSKFNQLAIGTSNGFILYPKDSEPGTYYDYQVLCSYPIDGDTWNRSDNRCGPSSYYPSDSGPCQGQNITTADEWYSHFLLKPDDLDFQCGFDVSHGSTYGNTASAFISTLEAMTFVKYDSNIYHYNELVIATWPSGIPDQLPIEAFFYIASQDKNTPITGGLLGAQYDQNDFYTQTGKIIPIIQVILPVTENFEAVFNYIPADQVVTNNNVADVLTVNYNNEARNCGSDSIPAYLCSGVMLHGSLPSLTHPWAGINPESFSILRRDAKFSKLANNMSNGFIFYPYLLNPMGKDSPSILCAFPVSGETQTRGDNGCGASSAFPNNSAPCQSQGITTASQWYVHYNNITGSSKQKSEHQCGFNMGDEYSSESATAFIETLNAMGMLPYGEYNEIRVASWSTSLNENLPLQAFFYLEGGLQTAQKDQENYFSDYNIVIPIVKITLPASVNDDAKFVYNQNDQVVTK